jgi:hypothetical protein
VELGDDASPSHALDEQVDRFLEPGVTREVGPEHVATERLDVGCELAIVLDHERPEVSIATRCDPQLELGSEQRAVERRPEQFDGPP